MPLYEYKCRKCLHIEELLMFKKRDDLTCKICYGPMKRAFSIFSINVIGGTPSNLTKQLHGEDNE